MKILRAFMGVIVTAITVTIAMTLVHMNRTETLKPYRSAAQQQLIVTPPTTPTPESGFEQRVTGRWLQTNTLCAEQTYCHDVRNDVGYEVIGLDIKADHTWAYVGQDQSGTIVELHRSWQDYGTWQALDTSVMNGADAPWQLNLVAEGRVGACTDIHETDHQCSIMINIPEWSGEKMILRNEGVTPTEYTRDRN